MLRIFPCPFKIKQRLELRSDLEIWNSFLQFTIDFENVLLKSVSEGHSFNYQFSTLNSQLEKLRFSRKEVIQPHLPIRLPCYDFTPIANPAFDGSLPALNAPALSN